MASVTPTGAPPPVTTPPPASPVEPFADFVIDVEDDDLELWDGDARAAALGGAARQATSLGGFLVGGDTPGDADGEADAIDEEKAAAKAAAKREKELKKAIKDYMKTSLSSERTFFKWVWCGLNLGALGMFSLAFFKDATPFPYRLLLTGAAWVAGLLAALYGLRQFYRRRHALLTATDDPSTWESPHAPAIVVAVFAGMLALIVIYAVASHQTFEVYPPMTIGGGG